MAFCGQWCLKVGVCLLQCKDSLSLPCKACLVPTNCVTLSPVAAKLEAEMWRCALVSGMLNPQVP